VSSNRIEPLTVAINHAVLQPDAIARHSHYAFHYVESWLRRRDKDKNVVVARMAVGNQRANPIRFGRKHHAVHEHVIANQEGVFHRTGRNNKRLQREGDDEQPGHQHNGNGCNKFRGCFFGLLRLAGFLDWFWSSLIEFLRDSQFCPSS